jgi:hypothetical protein
MKNKLFFVTFAFLIGFSNSAGQTKKDIEMKYGRQDNVYSMSEHILMTPVYDTHGQVCSMRLYPKRISDDINYLDDSLAIDEVQKIIDELIPLNTRGARKGVFGGTATGGGVAWTLFNYDDVAFTFISYYKLDKVPDGQFGESIDLNFDTDDKSLAEAERKEAMRPDDELIRVRTVKPKLLEIKWTNRKCVNS